MPNSPPSKMLPMREGEVSPANLDPGRGTESGKTRPVLIVQSEALPDAEHPSTLIIPMTTRLIDNAEPLRLRIPARSGLNKGASDQFTLTTKC